MEPSPVVIGPKTGVRPVLETQLSANIWQREHAILTTHGCLVYEHSSGGPYHAQKEPRRAYAILMSYLE
jgi:hypothetical protein